MASSGRAFLGLSWAERRLVLAASSVLPLTAASLRLLGFERTHAALLRLSPDPPASRGDDEALELARRTSHLVFATARNLYQSTCLPRALVLLWLLRWRGVDSDLRIGVRRVRGEAAITAHAWVEFRGCPLEDSAGVAEFTAFPEPIVPRDAGSR